MHRIPLIQQAYNEGLTVYPDGHLPAFPVPGLQTLVGSQTVAQQTP